MDRDSQHQEVPSPKRTKADALKYYGIQVPVASNDSATDAMTGRPKLQPKSIQKTASFTSTKAADIAEKSNSIEVVSAFQEANGSKELSTQIAHGNVAQAATVNSVVQPSAESLVLRNVVAPESKMANERKAPAAPTSMSGSHIPDTDFALRQQVPLGHQHSSATAETPHEVHNVSQSDALKDMARKSRHNQV